MKLEDIFNELNKKEVDGARKFMGLIEDKILEILDDEYSMPNDTFSEAITELIVDVFDDFNNEWVDGQDEHN